MSQIKCLTVTTEECPQKAILTTACLWEYKLTHTLWINHKIDDDHEPGWNEETQRDRKGKCMFREIIGQRDQRQQTIRIHIRQC